MSDESKAVTIIENDTAVEVVEPVSLAKLAQVLSVTDAQIIAHSAFVSKMYGALQNEDEAFIKILAGQELGITPIASIGGLYVYNGNVGMKVSIAGGLLKRAGYRWSTVWDDLDNPTSCEITFYHSSIPGGQYLSRFTRADAIRAKLLKADSAHEKYPKAMMFNRAFMDGARKIAPDVLLNFGYELDELKETEKPATQIKVETSKPKPSSEITPSIINSTTAPKGILLTIDCPKHPGTEAKLNKWGSGYSHPTNEKKDGKTVWCQTKLSDLPPTTDTPDPAKTSENAPEVANKRPDELSQAEVISMAMSKYEIEDTAVLGILKKGNAKLTKLEDVTNWNKAWEYLKQQLD